MDEPLIYRLRNNKQSIVIGSISLLIIVFLLTFFLNNVIVFATINSGTPVKLQVIKNGETSDVARSLITIIPRGSEALLAKSGNTTETLSSLSLPWYGFATITIDLKPSKTADKVAFTSPSGICTTYSSELKKLLRYDCISPEVLYEYQTPENDIWGDREIAELSYIENQILPPYMNGVIGITKASADSEVGHENHRHDTPIEIKVTTPTGHKSYEAPSGVTSESLAGLRIYTDTTNTTTSRFAFVDGFGAVYLASPHEQGNGIDYKIIEAPEVYSYRYNTTACSLIGYTTMCYRGRTKEALTEGAVALTQPKIEEYSFTSGLVKSTDIDSTAALETLYRADDNLYGIANNSLYLLTLTGDKYTTKLVAKDITSAVSDGKDIFFVKNKAAYIYNPKSQSVHLLFRSSYIDVRQLYLVDNKKFLFGPTKDSEDIIFAYELNDTSASGTKRLIDVLPLEASISDEIYANDLVGDKIFIQPYTDSVPDDEVRQIVIKELAKHDVQVKTEDIQITR